MTATPTVAKSVLNESKQIERAAMLIQMGARMQVLESETTLSYERLIRLYKEIAGKSPSKGQLPFSTDWFLTWQENIHSSLFLNIYEYLAKGASLDSVEQLTKAGAYKDAVADLKKPEAKLNFVMQCFERRKRRVEPMAAQQLVAVLGDRTGELAAMVGQLCFDFDDNPMTLDRVNQYLTSNPQVDGFRVADLALSGRTADAIIAMRSSVEQGTAPIALIGALAMKLRTMAKASAVRAGTISTAEAKTNPWVLKNATRQLSGWTSSGMSACIQMLAWADEQSKTNGSDPVYALERSIELISRKGHAA